MEENILIRLPELNMEVDKVPHQLEEQDMRDIGVQFLCNHTCHDYLSWNKHRRISHIQTGHWHTLGSWSTCGKMICCCKD